MGQEQIKEWGGDSFKRHLVANHFSSILRTVNTPAVIGIDAPYGMGKTFFVENWCNTLKDDNNQQATIFFNAWENDFSDDPLTAFVVDLQKGLVSLGIEENNGIIKGLIKSVGKIALQTIVSAAKACDTIGLDEINEQEKQGQFEQKYGGYAKHKIDAHLEVREGIKGFKEKLKEACAEIKKKSEWKLPVIVFIDELDRCRPDFAVRLLENIKHIFSVEDFIFVLSLDRMQLKHAIGSIYGQGMDTEGYLRRFIDFELRLPPPVGEGYVHSFPRIGNSGCHSMLGFCSIFTEYSKCFGLSLRAQEKIFKQIETSIACANGAGKECPELLAFLAVLKAKDEQLYDRIGKDLIDVFEIIEAIETRFEMQDYHRRKWNGNYGVPNIIIYLSASDPEIEIKNSSIDFQIEEILEGPDDISSDLQYRKEVLTEGYQHLLNLRNDQMNYSFLRKKTLVQYAKYVLEIGTPYLA